MTGNSQSRALGPGGDQAVSSRLSDQQQRTPDSRTCCDGDVAQRVVGRWLAERSRWRLATSGVGVQHSIRYCGALPWRHRSKVGTFKRSKRSHGINSYTRKPLSKTALAICHRPSVCLSSVYRLSVTFVRPTQATEIFGNISTPFGTLAICWHPDKILRRSSQGNPSVRGVKHKRGSRI